MIIVHSLEELRSHLWDERNDYMERIVDMLEPEMGDFEMGRHKGYITALDDVLFVLRNSFKYGDGVDGE